MHPKIQEKVVDELREVYYSDDVAVDYESIMKLNYLERVIKESLRLCPVVRKCNIMKFIICFLIEKSITILFFHYSAIIGRETQTNFKIGKYIFVFTINWWCGKLLEMPIF